MSAPECRRAHAQIASALVTAADVLGVSPADVLAQHHELAGQAEQALQYWIAAAEASGLASAHLEALQQYQRALAVLQTLPASVARTGKEVELVLAHAATLVGKYGYTHPEAEASFERVAALAPVGDDGTEVAFSARWGLWYAHNTRAKLARAWELANELKRIADQVQDASFLVSACEALCETSMCRGELAGAVRASRACEAAYVFEQHQRITLIRGDDPLLASLSFEALAEMLSGHLELAVTRVRQGLALAERLRYPHLLAGMMAQAAWMFLVWGGSGARAPDMTHARKHASDAIRVAQREGFLFWETYGTMIDAAARIAAGELTALADLQKGTQIWQMAGAALGRCWHLSFIAQALHGSGHYAEAGETLDEALHFCEASDSRYYQAEVQRRRAELFLDPRNPRHDPKQGLMSLGEAGATARRCGATWLELATMMTRVRLGDRPREQLEPELRDLVGSFPPSDDEPPLLREARAELLKLVRPHAPALA
jgi:hypothetical protein